MNYVLSMLAVLSLLAAITCTPSSTAKVSHKAIGFFYQAPYNDQITKYLVGQDFYEFNNR